MSLKTCKHPVRVNSGHIMPSVRRAVRSCYHHNWASDKLLKTDGWLSQTMMNHPGWFSGGSGKYFKDFCVCASNLVITKRAWRPCISVPYGVSLIHYECRAAASQVWSFYWSEMITDSRPRCLIVWCHLMSLDILISPTDRFSSCSGNYY